MPSITLVLFDIDGTLLLSDGAGRRAIHRALIEVFGSTGPEKHRFDGKTDRQIVRELMRLAGHEDPVIDERMDALLERYVRYLTSELADPDHASRLMPGVPELLDALEQRDDVILGLLTGNLVEGARAKLSAVGIDHARFRVGAYGSDHEIRSELPGIAQARTRDLLDIAVHGEQVVVIGDTPADLTCGRTIGARAIGVATGNYGVHELLELKPSAVFADLSDTDRVVSAIVRP
ncbi:MAG: hypothetical protein JWO05_664 [Gemmatimonadetes bacterium]|nr:hypothetical protein [Gemmatimonadota bacterium]